MVLAELNCNTASFLTTSLSHHLHIAHLSVVFSSPKVTKLKTKSLFQKTVYSARFGQDTDSRVQCESNFRGIRISLDDQSGRRVVKLSMKMEYRQCFTQKRLLTCSEI